ncbi:MAG: hypothetical protein H6708_25835 [Kofleriaceae bacterium]|nr:hypothetical protein [Kofleriaceae bacterium]
MRRGVAASLVAAAATMLGGCGDDAFTPTLAYRMLSYPAAAGGACPPSFAEAPPALAGATRARLTYLDSETGALRCDVVLGLDDGAAVIAVPDKTRPVDLVVEYVDDAGEVLGRGTTRGIDLGATGTVDVRVAASGAFACGLDRAAAPRAFHTATLLPTGEVLLLGGVAGPPGTDATVDGATGLFLQTKAEIWSPDTGELRLVSIPGAVPRAFHQAFVAGVDGDVVRIAVVGGISVTGDPATTPALVVGTDLRLEPSADAMGAAGEIISYDTARRTWSRAALDAAVDLLPRAFAGQTEPGATLAASGGLDLATAGRPVQLTADQIDRASGGRLATVPVRRPRVGATVTALGPDELLVWGGDVTSGVMTETPEVGELLTGWTTTPTAAALTIDGAGEVGPPRAFHTATRAGDGAVIVAGGFRMAAGVALTPVTSVIQRIAIAGGTATLTTLADGTVATAAGYRAAVVLADGDVLISGGNPDPVAAGCAPELQGLGCAIGEAWRYDSATATVAATGGLGVPRYGHQMTMLGDGMVLVTGGLAAGADAATLRALADVEIYEPRGTADDPLRPQTVRAPGDVVRGTDGAPQAPCGVVTVYDDDGGVGADAAAPDAAL